MIEINLVPENLRKKRRISTAMAPKTVSGLPKEVVLAILGAFSVLLVIVLIGVQIFLAVQIAKRNNLKNEYAFIAKDRESIEKTIKEIKDLNERVKVLEKVVGTHTVLWAEKINVISDDLPRGVWLTKVALEAKSLIIEGSAVSKLKTEIADIHAFTGKLRSDKNFMMNLKNLELDMIKAHNVESLSVADFKLKAAAIN